MFTYEEKDTNKKIETHEWEYLWWENKECDNHIIVVGDSISAGYRKMISKVSEQKWGADGFSTSKSVDNEYYKKSLDMFIKQRNNYYFMTFNNGLHGWHLSAEEYYIYYKEILNYLKNKEIPLAVILTTPAREKNDILKFAARNNEVIKRNEMATVAAKELNVPVIDLYNLIFDRSDLYSDDGIHLKNEGYEFVAKYICDCIVSIIGSSKKK